MGKKSKGLKYKCRAREIDQEKLDKLYIKTNQLCIECMHDCKNENTDIKYCINRNEKMNLNEIIELLKESNVDLKKMCDDYSLKLEYLMKMLKGEEILKYKYYICICDRLHLIKDNFEINKEYQQMFKKGGVDIQ